jgi:hypothetical protein
MLIIISAGNKAVVLLKQTVFGKYEISQARDVLLDF